MLNFNVNQAISGFESFLFLGLNPEGGNQPSLEGDGEKKWELLAYYGEESFDDFPFDPDSDDDEIPIGDLFDEELVEHKEDEEDLRYEDDEEEEGFDSFEDE